MGLSVDWKKKLVWVCVVICVQCMCDLCRLKLGLAFSPSGGMVGIVCLERLSVCEIVWMLHPHRKWLVWLNVIVCLYYRYGLPVVGRNAHLANESGWSWGHMCSSTHLIGLLRQMGSAPSTVSRFTTLGLYVIWDVTPFDVSTNIKVCIETLDARYSMSVPN